MTVPNEILIAKLHPQRFSDISGPMVFAISYILGISDNLIDHIKIDSDGSLFYRPVGGSMTFLMTEEQFEEEWNSILDRCWLPDDLRALAEAMKVERIEQFTDTESNGEEV